MTCLYPHPDGGMERGEHSFDKDGFCNYCGKQDSRPCSCHQSDNPPIPCARKYALSECLAKVKPMTCKEAGAIGGRATGPNKRRTRAHYRRANKIRWAKFRENKVKSNPDVSTKPDA